MAIKFWNGAITEIFRGSLVDTSISNKRNNRTSLCKQFGQLKALHNSLRPWQTRTHCCGHIVANTNVSPFACTHNICCGHKFCVRDTNFVSGTQKCFWFCSETFCVRNKCFPVCTTQETSWATMCPQQSVLVYQKPIMGKWVPMIH